MEWLEGGHDKPHWKRDWKPFQAEKNANKQWLLQRLPPYAKVFYQHWSSLHFSDRDSYKVAECLPGIRYVLLRRRDQIGTAVSFYIAINTKKWFLSNDAIDVNRETLLNVYDQTLTWWNAWDDYLYGNDYLEVYYEDLVSDTAEINRILNYLEIQRKVNYERVTKQNQHPQKQEIRSILEDAIAKGDAPSPTFR